MTPLPKLDPATAERIGNIYESVQNCTECGGAGEQLIAYRWAGEAYGEQVSTDCDLCHGKQVFPCECRCCGKTRPIFDDDCSECRGETLLADLGDGRFLGVDEEDGARLLAAQVYALGGDWSAVVPA